MQALSLFLIALGGAAGTLMRYGLSKVPSPEWLSQPGGWSPLGTLLANALGAFFLAYVVSALGERVIGTTDIQWKTVLGTGMMGGFTTYSTFNLETLQMFQNGHAPRAVAYVLSTVLVCLVLGAAGWALGR